MSTAKGFIKSVAGGSKFTATFVIDDIQYTFSGSFNPAVQEFTCNEATLSYSAVGELVNQRAFEGKIGTDDILITVKNGPEIKGPLILPINPAAQVAGMGTWSRT
ncbi:hypothetical protein V8C40DRAFT_234068 [Trichoderma camerunense]